MFRILAMGTTGLLGLGLGALLQGPPPDGPPPRPPEAKKKGPGGPEGELHRAYELLRRLRSEGSPAGKPEERLKDLTERATRLYRQAIEAEKKGDDHASHEYGIAAHDLARAVDHARNAAQVERPDPELPPPPPGRGPEGTRERTRRDLWHAYDRIHEARDRDDGPEAKFYLDAARDLYTAARRDAEADRDERAGELARAAEAITHVPEHLARAADDGDRDRPKAKRDRPEPRKEKADRPKAKRDRPDSPKEKADRPGPGDELPPPLDD